MNKRYLNDLGFAGAFLAVVMFVLLPAGYVPALSHVTQPLESEDSVDGFVERVYVIEPDEDMSASGIDHYLLLIMDDGSATVKVNDADETVAVIDFETASFGGTATIRLNQDVNPLVVEFHDREARGYVVEDGEIQANWSWDSQEGTYIFAGFDELDDPLRWGLFISVLGDEGLHSVLTATTGTVGTSSPPVRRFPWLPAVPIVLTFGWLTWCINQCQCCENWHLTCWPNCFPEPTCCDNCFSLKCLSL